MRSVPNSALSPPGYAKRNALPCLIYSDVFRMQQKSTDRANGNRLIAFGVSDRSGLEPMLSCGRRFQWISPPQVGSPKNCLI
jgi:hypothetical protein